MNAKSQHMPGIGAVEPVKNAQGCAKKYAFCPRREKAGTFGKILEEKNEKSIQKVG